MNCILNCFSFLYRIRAQTFNKVRLAYTGYRGGTAHSYEDSSMRPSLKCDVMDKTLQQTLVSVSYVM